MNIAFIPPSDKEREAYYILSGNHSIDQLVKQGWDEREASFQVVNHINPQGLHTIVDIDKKEPVGYIEIIESSYLVVVPNLQIIPEHRRKGYASAAIDALVRDFPGKRIHSIVTVENTRSINLHQKKGFKIIGHCYELHKEVENDNMQGMSES